MKKRAKIITTIASLCLAVALMTFGVFAATSATLGLTSKVKFTVVDVLIKYNVKVAGGNQTALTGDAAAATTATANLYNDSSFEHGKTYDRSVVADYGQEASNTLALGAAGTEIEFNSTTADGRTITYLITVYNAGTNDAGLHVTETTKFLATVSSASTNMTVTYKKAVNTATIPTNADAFSPGAWAGDYKVEAGKYASFLVTLTIIDVAQPVNSGNVLDNTFLANLTLPSGD